MRTEIKELHQRLKTTSIYVTHDQIEAMTMADKIVVMRDGVVEQQGAPLELYDRPANTFVAGFIGSPAMNLLPGTVRSGGRVEFGGGASLPLPPDARADDGQPVLFGIRPEHCAPARQGLPAEIVVVEPTGADTQLYCKLDGKDFTAVVRDRTSVHPGERVMLQPDVAKTHLFDASTGRRLAA
jgi:multiple sugar transport system ATP-binding protein